MWKALKLLESLLYATYGELHLVTDVFNNQVTVRTVHHGCPLGRAKVKGSLYRVHAAAVQAINFRMRLSAGNAVGSGNSDFDIRPINKPEHTLRVVVVGSVITGEHVFA